MSDIMILHIVVQILIIFHTCQRSFGFECSKILVTDNGIISSSECQGKTSSALWHIQAPKGKVIRLTTDYIDMNYYDLQYNYQCRYNHIQVESGGNRSQVIGLYCNKQRVEVTSLGNTLLIRWKNEFSSVYLKEDAFQLRYWFQDPSVGCGEGYFVCADTGKCLSSHYMCDWYEDCYDRSDEENCTSLPTSCGEIVAINDNEGVLMSHRQFNQSIYPPFLDCFWGIQAPIGKYVRLSTDFMNLYYYNAVCNDYIQIKDGTHENDTVVGPYCGDREVSFVSTNDTVLIRFESDKLYQGLGFQLRYRYIDSIECGNGFIKCSTSNTICVPSEKVCDTFNDCGDWSDENNCNIEIDIPWMMLSNKTSVKIMNAQSSYTNISVAMYGASIGRGLDYGNSSIVWTGSENRTIHYTIYNITTGKFSSTETVIKNEKHIGEVVVDWITKSLYWIAENNIRVSQYNGAYRRTLISAQLGYPVTLKLDSFERLMIWGVGGTESSINVMEMSGNLSTYRSIVKKDVFYPGGLTLDLVEKMIYWSDASLGQIQACDYSGNGRRVVITIVYPMPYRITLYKDFLFWTTYMWGKVYTCEKKTGNRYRTLPLTEVENLKWFDSSLYNESVTTNQLNKNLENEDNNPCIDNGGCEHLCLLSRTAKNFSCACADGYLLFQEHLCIRDPCSRNKYLDCTCFKGSYITKTHKPTRFFPGIADALIVAEKCSIYTLSLDPTYKNIRIRQNNGSDVPGYVDFDPVENVIYWTEGLIDPEIRKSKYGTPDSSELVLRETKEIWLCGIAVDWITRNLYWCVYSSRTIKGRLLHGNSPFVVTMLRESVFSMTFDPFHGHIYWTAWEPKPGIYRSSVDGKHTDLVTETSKLKEPYSLTVDYVSRKLFWIDGKNLGEIGLDVFNNYNISNSDIKSVHPSALDLFGDIFYAANTKNIWTIDKITRRIGTEQIGIDALLDGWYNINGLKAIMLKKQDVEPKCPTYARCWGIKGRWQCLDESMICDGVPDCLGHIDEFYCKLCDKNCSSGVLNLHCIPSSRSYAPETGMFTFLNWESHPFSKFITLENYLSSDCSISLQYFDRKNKLQKKIDIPLASKIHVLRQIMKSKIFRDTEIVSKLVLSGRSLVKDINEETFLPYSHISNLTIYSTSLYELPEESVQNLSNIVNLNISYNRISILEENALSSFEDLDIIDIRGNDLRLTSDIFQNNKRLRIIYSDSYSFCCIKPESVVACYAPIYDVSSCTDLIQDSVLRVFLWLVGIFAFAGNICVLIYKFVIGSSSKGTFSIFVNNLSLSDTMMGLYLLIIAVHDAMFRGHYAWKDYDWRHSALCKFSGILSMLSSEASVGFICFITLDRFLAVKYPIGGPRLSKTFSRVLSAVFWCVAILLAVIPIFPFPEFYSTSGICIALPITSYFQDGLTYSVVVFLGVNFFMFCALGVGQFLIFREILVSASQTKRELTEREKSVATMLAWVVMTDFFCWIPIGIMVVLALSGTFIPREVYAWVVVFVLPINSAINPFIYTFSGVIREKITQLRRRRSTDDRGSSQTSQTTKQSIYSTRL